MPRKRMLDPGIWTDDKIMQLSDSAFIVFIGCISNADDEGIFETNPSSLFFKLARKCITPDVITTSLDEIAVIKLIIRFGVYAFFPNWYKHQTLNRPSTTKFKRPPPEEIKKLPLYIEGWESAFSYYKGKGEDRERVSVQYPFKELSLQFHEHSVSPHGVVTPNRNERNMNMNMNMNMKGKEGQFTEDSQPPKYLPQAELLADQITANDPGHFKSKDRAKIVTAWADDIRKLIEIDKRDTASVEAVIRWCQADNFWASNILSAVKLRKQFPTLLMKMQRPGTNGESGAGHSGPRDGPQAWETADKKTYYDEEG